MMEEIPKKIMDEFEELCIKNNISGKQKEEKLQKLKEMIKKMKYEPGEAVGVIAAQSISEPATQMSIDGKESVIVKYNDSIRIIEIGKFVDALVGQGQHVDGWDIADVSSQNIFVPALTDDEKIEWKRLLAVSRHASPEKLIRLETRSGRSIIATDSHSFVVRDNNEIRAVSGKSLKIGSRIPVIKLLPENCIDEIKLSLIIGENCINRKNIRDSVKLDEDFGFFVGAYLAEGNATKNYINISNTDESFLSRIRKFANSLGLTFNEYDNHRGFSKGHDIRINSALLSKIIANSCGTGSKNKKVPQFAFSAREEFVKGLLRGYFEGDGNISVERAVICASSDSKELIDGIAILLNRFGIFSLKHSDKQHNIVIPHKYAKIFYEKIGFQSMKKSETLQKLCLIKNKQDYIDMFSGFGDILLRICKKLNYPSRYVSSATKRQKIGREALLRHIEIFQALSQKYNIDIKNELSILRKMYESDVIWDEIVNIEYIKPSSEYVYDFTVEDAETFTTFDGIITHNTMRSYTLASQSDRLSKVTQGLPRLIEIFDARKNFEKNMRIYLLPEYNNKNKATEIANKIKKKEVRDIIISNSIDLVDMKIELELINKEDKDILKELITKYIKEAEITIRENKITIKPKTDDIKLIRKYLNKLLGLHVKGIKDIEQVIVVKEGEDWVLQTRGANLKEVLKTEGVDISRTTTNDPFQVMEVLGIEAARNVILKEALDTLEEQGLDVDIRHIILLADMMTVLGDIKAIGRYGVSGEKASILARANFEETKKHLMDAAFYGEVDDLDGIIENVMIGQVAPVGTGMVQLAVDIEKMKKAIKRK